MNAAGTKLEALRTRANCSIRAAALLVGMKSPSAWKHYEDDKSRMSIPADMVITLLREWVGEGDPAISTEDVLELSPSLRDLFHETGGSFSTTIHDERDNLKVDIHIQARNVDDMRNLLKAWTKATE